MGISSSRSVAMDVNSPTYKFVADSIKNNAVVIFSKSYCPYCNMAKQVFDGLNISYKSIELNDIDNGDEMQNILGQMTGARTVPRVFVKGTCIGGGTDTKKMAETNELQKMLEVVEP